MRVQPDRELVEMHNAIYMPMLQTAEVVAKRYNISRDAMDEYALQSQQRTAAAQAAGYFDAEIVPVTTVMNVVNKETGEVSQKDVTIAKDEGNRADTQLAGLQALQPVLGPDMTITAGNASQLSDGASASILMEAKLAEKRVSTRLAVMSAWRLQVQSLTKWALVRYSQSPNCFSVLALRWTISAFGN